MPVQTYCTQTDVEAILSPQLLTRVVDDGEAGFVGSPGQSLIASAIERAAGKMNASLEMRYVLGDLAGNDWCRDCNAAVAAYLLVTRRGNPPPDNVQRENDDYLSDLREIGCGKLKVPQVNDSNETIPTVTNFGIDLRAGHAKVRRVAQTSSGSPPPADRKSHPLEP